MNEGWEDILDITDLRLEKAIEKACIRTPDAGALSDLTTSWTYRQLWDASTSISILLGKMGLHANEPVVISINNECTDIAAFIGVWRAGGVAVPVHVHANAGTWEKLVSLTTARYILSPRERDIAYLGTAKRVDDLLYRSPISDYVPDAILNDAALIVFTSGTTGLPKGVVQSHSQYTRKLYALSSVIRPRVGLTTLQYLQLSFSFGQWTSFLTLALGGHLILRPRFNAEGFWNDIKLTECIDWVPVVPSMLRLFLHKISDVKDFDLFQETVGYLLVGGEVMPYELGKKLRAYWPQTGIIDIYGLTETNSGDFILRAEEYDRAKGAIGMPTPGVAFRIADGDTVLPAGEIGELEVASTFRMKGYLRSRELTDAVMHGDYLKTGDIGWMDERGMVHLKGRRTEQINTGGRKVSPLEIEDVYLKHEGVTACLAGAIPDELLGECPALLVIPAGGNMLTAGNLIAWGREYLEHYKIPVVFEFVNEFPAGGTGKADRSMIKKLIKR